MAEPWTDGDVATAADLAGLPWGVMGYALGATSDQSGISTDTDVTGLSVTFTAVSSRLYRIQARCFTTQQTSDGAQSLQVTDSSGTQLNAATQSVTTDGFAILVMDHLETGLSGSVTRKVQVTTNAGTMTVRGSANVRSTFLVEDLGAA